MYLKSLRFLAVLLATSFGLSIFPTQPQLRFAECQNPSTKHPLDGCPAGTLFVSPTDKSAHFTTVQSAISSLTVTDSSQAAIILVGRGNYLENVTIYTQTPLVILGQTANPREFSDNLAEVVNSLAIIAVPGASNINTSTMAIDGPPTVEIHNLNLTNAWPSTNHSAALAIGLNKGNISFYSTSFKSFQDTLYVGSKSNAYFESCEVRGQTDFIFGQGRAWFENISIGVRNTGDIPLAGIVAWQGASGQTNGAYIRNSFIGLAPDHNTTHDLTGTMALGRPWNNFSTTIFIDTFMGSVVNGSGFTAWAGRVFDNVTYAEYGSYGPGYQPSKRLLDQESLGTAEEGIEKYSLESVFGGEPTWI